MKYYLHKEGRHVATLDDDEKPDSGTLAGGPDAWQEVHLHAGPGTMHSEPKTWAKVVAVTFALLMLAGVLALLGAGVVAAWNVVL